MVKGQILVRKIRPTLGQIISETKCDRDKPILSTKKRVNKI